MTVPRRGHLAIRGDVSVYRTAGRGLRLLASGEWRPRMQLNILHGTAQPPRQRIVPPPVLIEPRLRNSRLGQRVHIGNDEINKHIYSKH